MKCILKQNKKKPSLPGSFSLKILQIAVTKNKFEPQRKIKKKNQEEMV